MNMFKMWKIVFIWLLAYVSTTISAKTLPLPQIFVNLLEEQPGKTVTQFHNLTEPEYAINVVHINTNVDFFIIQVHTYIENITLSFTDPSEGTLDNNSFITGTNIGLVKKVIQNKISSIDDSTAVFYLLHDQMLTEEFSILLSVSTYTKNDPIPGGCNLSFETELAPYQKITESNEIITVMSQPPSIFGEFCNKSNITTEMYYLFLKEYNNSTEEYFMGLQKMMTATNITKYGTKVPRGLAHSKFKQMYNRYSGTGRIFAVVSTYEGRSSAYIPAASFGCNLKEWDEDCLEPDGVHWKLVIAFLLLCGIFICLGGHRYFKTGLFIVGYTFGVIVMLIVVTIDEDFSTEGKAIYSLIMGFFVAVTWVFLWWKFGIPVVAVQLAFLLAGLIAASILFYTQLGDVFIFADEPTFWISFAIIMVVSQLPLIYLKPLFHIIALSLLGSYAVIVAMNFYIGGNLPYILINTYRRITVTNFGMAVIDPPYQLLDFCQTILWILIFAVGIHVQYKHSLGKPPFPPNRSGIEIRSPNERTPLITSELPPAYSA